MDSGNIVKVGKSLGNGMMEVLTFNQELLVSALRIDQNGKSAFPEFLIAIWQAGVVGYEVDFDHEEYTEVEV